MTLTRQREASGLQTPGMLTFVTFDQLAGNERGKGDLCCVLSSKVRLERNGSNVWPERKEIDYQSCKH